MAEVAYALPDDSDSMGTSFRADTRLAGLATEALTSGYLRTRARSNVDDISPSWHVRSIMPSDQYLQFLASGELDTFMEPIIHRIRLLCDLASKEDDQKALRPESLVGFFRFMYIHRNRVADCPPQLILTTEGYLRAEWRRSRDCRVAVRFVDMRTVSFVTFLPDKHVRSRINRIGGNSSTQGFFENTGITTLPSASPRSSRHSD